MPKRGAEIQMNHENYDDPLPDEDAGEYSKADTATISTRKIIKARRRVNETAASGNTSQTSLPVANPFKGFCFGAAQKPLEDTTASTGTIGLSEARLEAKALALAEIKTQNLEQTRVESSAVRRAEIASATECNASSTKSETSEKKEQGTKEAASVRKTNGSETQPSCRTYLKHLRKLNEDLLNWLSTNLRSNPFCILSPMFADYARHLDEIERLYHAGPCLHHPAALKALSSSSSDANSGLSQANSAPKMDTERASSEPSIAPTVPKVEDLVALAKDIPDGPLLTGSESLTTRGFQFAFRDKTTDAPQEKASASIPEKSTQMQPAVENKAAEATPSDNRVGAAEPFRFGSTAMPTFSNSFVFGSNTSQGTTGFKFNFPASSTSSASNSTTTMTSSVLSTSSAFSSGTSLFSGVFAFKPQTTSALCSDSASNTVSQLPFLSTTSSTNQQAESDTKPKTITANEKPSSEANSCEDADDGEYEPPKVERVEQVETDSTFSVRCKLLYRMLGSSAAATSNNSDEVLTKGVGTLSLKPVCGDKQDGSAQTPETDASEKLQLVVRAETALATVLLNLLVSRNSLLRLSRNESSKSVSFVAVPNPPFEAISTGKPAQLFVRVKTTEECNSLYDQLSRVVNAS